jgi:hypothetical protein
MYEVQFYSGEYITRQQAANRDGAAAYVEHHFNSGSEAANYAVAVVGTNASQKSKDWGQYYARNIAREFGINVGRKLSDPAGIFIGGWDGKRGNGSLVHTRMPALLVEPLFGSNPKHAEWIRSVEGRVRLARVLADSIMRFFPQGGLVAFSIGHKGKTSKPHDRGAAVHGGGMEADYAEMVLLEAKSILERATPAEIAAVNQKKG